MGEFFNLDNIIEKEKIITLAGRKINVAKVPAVVIFRTDELRDKLDNLNLSESRGVLEEAVELVMIIAQASGTPIEKKWLLENATVQQILIFISVATFGKDLKNESKKKEAESER